MQSDATPEVTENVWPPASRQGNSWEEAGGAKPPSLPHDYFAQ